MERTKLLYKIKNLDKIIVRKLLSNFCVENEGFLAPPTPTQMQIIEYIIKHMEENVYQRDLETVLNLRRATVSGVLQTMEKNELIERVIDSEDTRAKKIMLNEKAKKIFIDSRKKLENLEKIMAEGIPEEEIEIFYKVIEKMEENIQNHNLI